MAAPGVDQPGLVLVSTPIGNLGDMTIRGLAVLRAAGLVLCEDTRVTAHLLRHFGISCRTLALHDHNEDSRIPEVLRALAGGLPVLEDFEAAALGAALGRDMVVHAVLARGGLADHLRIDAGRYAGLRIMPVGLSPVGPTGLTTDQSDTND